MANLEKAIAFAKHCLKWDNAATAGDMHGTLIRDGRPGSTLSFNPSSLDDVQTVLREFLGNRYFIQINRDKTGLFQWQVIVGQQGLTGPGACSDHARAEDEDLLDAIFEACALAARMDRRPAP